MKLRNYTITLSLLFIAELIYLMLNKGDMVLTSEPYSALGNIAENYLVFLFGTALLLIGFILMVNKMYKLTDIKRGIEIFLFPAVGIITLLIPYKKELMITTLIHTLLGIMTAIILLWIIIKFNKVYTIKKGFKQTFSKLMPAMMFFGTLILFLIFGLNAIMEIFYSVLLLSWVNIVNFKLENETANVARLHKKSKN